MNNILRQRLGPTAQCVAHRQAIIRELRVCSFRPVQEVAHGFGSPAVSRELASHRQGIRCQSAAAAAVKPCCKAAAAAATAATAASPVVTAALPEVVMYTVLASTFYTALSFIAMAVFPRKSAGFFSSVWPFIPLCLAYVALLVYSWSPDTLSIMMPGSLQEGLSGGFNPQFIPQLEGISQLFGRLEVTASWLLHVLVINLFAGRWCLLEGLRQGIPTAHTVLACSVFGPLGLLCHYATMALTTVVPGLKEEEKTVTLKSEGGSITLLPYTDASS